MKMRSLQFVISIVVLMFSLGAADDSAGSRKVVMKPGLQVSYDRRSLIIDGQRKILVSGSIHYPRSTPEMWPELIAKSKQGGLDVIQTYVFWNGHETEQGSYDFQGRYDLVQFIKLIKEAGLYVSLRIGPYVCAEWNFGGFPMWLLDIPGVELRTNNKAFKIEMERFVRKIVSLMQENELFAEQGGPIILAQIENEYGNVDYAYGEDGNQYLLWAASLTRNLSTSIPWIMCQQPNAPADIINTCNGFYCDDFLPNADDKPIMWTENWTGWFHLWGGLVPHRPAEDIAYAVARFYQKGGSFQNYYMYHGGTNFGRTSGGPFVTSSYDYDAPLDEYGQERQPKWGHLKDLHAAIKLTEPALVASDTYSLRLSLSAQQEAYVYSNVQNPTTVEQIVAPGSLCAAYISNQDTSDASVTFNGKNLDLPGRSVSILPDCKTTLFNTAKVNTQTSLIEMREALVSIPLEQNTGFQWFYYQDPFGISENSRLAQKGLLEQLLVTHDKSDYLWYATSVQISETDIENIATKEATLSISRLRDGVHIFVNSQPAGGAIGNGSSRYFDLVQPVSFTAGSNDIEILSFTVGLQNYGARFEAWGAGIQGEVTLKGLPSGEKNLSNAEWSYQVGLKGERLALYTEVGSQSVTWNSGTPSSFQPLVWYMTRFDAPSGDDPVAVYLGGMGKGQAWINGQHIGRYWSSVLGPQSGCPSGCNYRVSYDQAKCATGCGQPSQVWYHVPRSWLQPNGNLLVLFEEIGGDVSAVSFATRSTSSICAHVPQSDTVEREHIAVRPQARLRCSSGHIISSIKFASFGNAEGSCGSFEQGTCHAPNSSQVVQKACVGKQECAVDVAWQNIQDTEPCPGTPKSLVVEAICSPLK